MSSWAIHQNDQNDLAIELGKKIEMADSTNGL
jgi:hypothetical protein